MKKVIFIGDKATAQQCILKKIVINGHRCCQPVTDRDRERVAEWETELNVTGIRKKEGRKKKIKSGLLIELN